VQFTVRDYRREDFDTIWRIDQACFPAGIAYSRFELKVYIRRPAAFGLVAESCEKQPSILGFLVAESSRRGIGHIVTIDVRAEARRFHIGSSLLEAAELRLRSVNCHLARLETAVDNVSALAFYKRHGYDVMKTVPRYYSNGVDALLFEKELRSAGSSS
jgi:[ribosomal protein S18]-alanine N-acetyltransferase